MAELKKEMDQKVTDFEEASAEKKEAEPDEYEKELNDMKKENQDALDDKQKELDEQEDDSWDAELVGERQVFQEKKDAKLEELTTQRDADAEYLEAFTEALVEKNLPVIKEVKTDITADYVHIKLIDLLKDHFEFRPSLIEKQQAKAIDAKNLGFYEESFTYKQSKFGLNCPLHQSNPEKTKKFATLYRERIYYPASGDA
jgi:signal recognition particle GTPase